MIEKYYNEKGEVGVLLSPEYGGGWYTWGRLDVENPEELIFDKTLIEMILNKRTCEEIEKYVLNRWPEMDSASIDDLSVEFLPKGTVFRINEYDCNEYLEFRDKIKWIIA